MDRIQFFKQEVKSLLAFAKKPVYKFQQQSFKLNLIRFGIVLFINILLMLIAILLISALALLGYDKILNTNKISELFSDFPAWVLGVLLILVIPVIEEFVFRFQLKYRKCVLHIFIPLIFCGFIYLISIALNINFFILSIIGVSFYIIFNKKISDELRSIWSDKFHFVFYATTLLFALVHISNYEFSKSILLIFPILIFPQFIVGFFIGYLRVKTGFVWGGGIACFS